MKRLTLAIPVLLGAGIGVPPPRPLAAERQAVGPAPAPEEKALLSTRKGVLDRAALDRFQSEIREWIRREEKVGYLILTIDSPGTVKGQFGPAADAARFLDGLKNVRVIVRIGR